LPQVKAVALTAVVAAPLWALNVGFTATEAGPELTGEATRRFALA
jgi:hypothetical protein